MSDAFFFWLGVSGFDSKTHDVTSVISYWYLCSSHFVMWVQPDALLSPYLLWVWLKLVLVTWLQVLEKKNFNFQKTENLGGKYMQVQCFSLKFLYSQLFCFLLAAFWVEQLMAKNQEFLVFYLAFSFTAEKKMLMELWLQWLNMDFFTKKNRGPRLTCKSSEIAQNFEEQYFRGSKTFKSFLGSHNLFLSSTTDFFRTDVVQRSSVVLHFW